MPLELQFTIQHAYSVAIHFPSCSPICLVPSEFSILTKKKHCYSISKWVYIKLARDWYFIMLRRRIMLIPNLVLGFWTDTSTVTATNDGPENGIGSKTLRLIARVPPTVLTCLSIIWSGIWIRNHKKPLLIGFNLSQKMVVCCLWCCWCVFCLLVRGWCPSGTALQCEGCVGLYCSAGP